MNNEEINVKERLEYLLESIPDAILYQTGGGIEYISSNVERILGYPAEEFTKDRKFFPSLIHPDDMKRIDAELQAWYHKGAVGTIEMEFRLKKANGDYIWLLDRSKLAFKTDDGRHSTLGVMLDITERKHIEEEHKRLIGDLQEALLSVKTLSGLIPICACCKSIRNDKGYWEKIEKFINERSQAQFSHSICPECAKKMYPDTAKKMYPEVFGEE